jgi:hypothetical protein
MKKIKYKIIDDRNYLILNGPTKFWDYTKNQIDFYMETTNINSKR